MNFLSIRNLYKIYNDNKPNKCVALENINLNFISKGMHFIVGKSGSGKSTLLNIIGGIDNLTSGNVYLKNKEYNSFTNKDFDKLRKNEIGFVFQDFCLIDNLTVNENIELSAIIKENDKRKNKINELIELVGLKGMENRLCKELSAGQRQRVAVARAMIKNPEILLCDEPTGNLDYQTSKVILELLKKISKEILVIVVSHNLDDAYAYGNRIIELKDGKVKRDISLDSSYSFNPIVGDKLYITSMKSINDNELENINFAIKNGQIKEICHKKQLFNNEELKETIKEYKTYPNKKISFKNLFLLTNKLLRKQLSKIILFGLAIALMLAIVAISYMFINYDRTTAVKQIVNQSDTNGEIFSHFPISYNKINPITTDELVLINNLDYDGTISQLISLPSFYSSSAYPERYLFTSYGQSLSYAAYRNNFTNRLHFNISSGILITNEQYIKKTFDIKGDIEYLAIADEIKPYGIYITDFEIDEYFANSNRSFKYENYVGQLKTTETNFETNRYYINGIIKTNYQEKYHDILHILDEARTDSNKKSQLAYNEKVLEYLFFATHYYMIGYTTNQNFINDYIENLPRTLVYMPGFDMTVTISDEEVVIFSSKETSIDITSNAFYLNIKNKPNSQKTIYLPAKYLNNVTNQNLSYSEWNERLRENNKIHLIKKNDLEIVEYNLEYNIEVTNNSRILLSEDVLKELLTIQIKPIRIYFDNTNDLKKVYITLTKENFNSLTANTDYANKVAMGIEVYNDFFKITFVISLLAVILIILFASYHSVNRFRYEIGVLKSLGLTNGAIFGIFIIQLIYLVLTIIILSTITILIATTISNKVLISAFNNLYHISLYNIKVLFISDKLVNFLLTIVLSTSIVSTLIPLFILKFMKPINIIKARY